MYGGTEDPRLTDTNDIGLSPRVRGNLECAPDAWIRSRSIPACTGEPGKRRIPQHHNTVYPRVYGGTSVVVPQDRLRTGLSPRVRGNLVAVVFGCWTSVSIPACTGEPLPSLAAGKPLWVYPRVYGGTVDIQETTGRAEGLSPRVRGNRHRAPCSCDYAGSIPACTGEPWPSRTMKGLCMVYPRVYGGTSPFIYKYSSTIGLSPRVRGNLSGAGPASAR